MQTYWNPVLKKSNNSRPKATNVQKILSEVNMKIFTFLEELQLIYTKNDMRFDVVYLQDALTRLLTPFQLGNQSNIFSSYDFPKKNITLEQEKFLFQDFQGRYKTTIQDLKLIPASNQVQQAIAREKRNKGVKPCKQNKTYFHRKQRSRPVLAQEAQCELVDWALNRLKQNKRIRRKDLARRAKRLSGNKQGFAGSIGWVNRFLQRHPGLAGELKKVARNNIGVRFGEYTESPESQCEFQKFQNNGQSLKGEINQESQKNYSQLGQYEEETKNKEQEQELDLEEYNNNDFDYYNNGPFTQPQKANQNPNNTKQNPKSRPNTPTIDKKSSNSIR